MTPSDMIAFLKKLGWREKKTRSLWRWREPRTKALYRLKDAWSLEQSRKRGRKAV